MLIGERESLDHLAGVVQPEHIGAGLYARPGDGVAQAEVPQHMHRIGADLDAGADLAQLRRLFVDLDVVARLHQARCGGKPAEAGAGDKNSVLNHEDPFLRGRSSYGSQAARRLARFQCSRNPRYPQMSFTVTLAIVRRSAIYF